jgi:hypothetical protein
MTVQGNTAFKDHQFTGSRLQVIISITGQKQNSQ